MHAITLFQHNRRRIMAVLASVIALCVFAYGALLIGAVAHAAHRTDAETKLQTLSSEVSALEGRYLSLAQALSPERATSLGFVAPTSVATVFAATQTLTFAEDSFK